MWYDISDTYMDNRPESKYFCPCGHLSVQRQPGSAHASYRYPHSQSETRREAPQVFRRRRPVPLCAHQRQQVVEDGIYYKYNNMKFIDKIFINTFDTPLITP